MIEELKEVNVNVSKIYQLRFGCLISVENLRWTTCCIDLRTTCCIDLRTTNSLREEKRKDAQAKRQKYNAEFLQTICFDETTIEIESPNLVNYDNESTTQIMQWIQCHTLNTTPLETLSYSLN